MSKPCMFCEAPTLQGCVCGAACCERCGDGLCPICIRIQNFWYQQAIAKLLVPWQVIEAPPQHGALVLLDPNQTEEKTVSMKAS